MASTLRLGAGLVLLGCGALAAPSSRVAFVQHGVGEGENAIMHARSSSKTAMLTPQMLASAIARVMSLDARAELGTELPAGDIFNRPDGNVMVFVDGVRPQGESCVFHTRVIPCIVHPKCLVCCVSSDCIRRVLVIGTPATTFAGYEQEPRPLCVFRGT